MTPTERTPPPSSRWSVATADSPAGGTGHGRLWRRPAGAAAIMAVLVVGNASSANASARSSVRTPAPGTASSTSPADDAGSALHGEFRVINRDGSVQLRRWQSGAVDAIDNLMMTVRSADGFDSTYLLGPGISAAGVLVGDEVTVVGTGPAVPA